MGRIAQERTNLVKLNSLISLRHGRPNTPGNKQTKRHVERFILMGYTTKGGELASWRAWLPFASLVPQKRDRVNLNGSRGK
jgi:hypothetical protein